MLICLPFSMENCCLGRSLSYPPKECTVILKITIDSLCWIPPMNGNWMIPVKFDDVAHHLGACHLPCIQWPSRHAQVLCLHCWHWRLSEPRCFNPAWMVPCPELWFPSGSSLRSGYCTTKWALTNTHPRYRTALYVYLVGGFNPFEKYLSN